MTDFKCEEYKWRQDHETLGMVYVVSPKKAPYIFKLGKTVDVNNRMHKYNSVYEHFFLREVHTFYGYDSMETRLIGSAKKRFTKIYGREWFETVLFDDWLMLDEGNLIYSLMIDDQDLRINYVEKVR